jgi:hypothetical protein
MACVNREMSRARNDADANELAREARMLRDALLWWRPPGAAPHEVDSSARSQESRRFADSV